MSIINANGWLPQSITLQRSVTAPAATDSTPSTLYVPQPTAAVASASQSQAGNGTSQQSFKDNLDEAMAKLKVELDNLGASAGTEKSAADEFREYMALSPEEKIRQKVLADIGLTPEEYDALPPEKKDAIDKQIAQLTKDKNEQQSLANLEPTLKAMTGAINLVSSLGEAESKSSGNAWKDPRENQDPLA